MTEPRWCLMKDDGGRAFLIPVARYDEAWKIIDEVGEYWSAPLRGEPYPKDLHKVIPDWMKEVRGTWSVSFTDPKDDL